MSVMRQDKKKPVVWFDLKLRMEATGGRIIERDARMSGSDEADVHAKAIQHYTDTGNSKIKILSSKLVKFN